MNKLQASTMDSIDVPFKLANKTTGETLYIFSRDKQKSVAINSSIALRLKNKGNKKRLDDLLDEHGCVEIEYTLSGSKIKTGIYIKKP